MTENEIATIVVNAAFKIHSRFGPGLLESVYETILGYELRKRGLFVRHQPPLPVVYEEMRMNIGFRPDLVINKKVIVEVKSVERIPSLGIGAKQGWKYTKPKVAFNATSVGNVTVIGCDLFVRV